MVDYRARERIVRLVRGQALFDVAHAPDRPFSVIVAGRKVTALGTIFEVRFDKKRLKVTLLRGKVRIDRSEEHTSELQLLMRISFAVFCLKKTKQINNRTLIISRQIIK